MAGLVGLVGSVQAQVVVFSGQVQAGNLGANPWVQGSTMWESVENGTSTATSVNGFNFPASVAGFNPALFTMALGGTANDGENMELTSSLSPGGATAGFEIYTNSAGSNMGIDFSYNGSLWASGTVDQIRTDVVNSAAQNATGSGQVTLTAAGVDSTFFDEIMTLSGNTGVLAYTFTSFAPVNAQGLFNSAGSFTVVPEPSEYAVVFGVLGIGAVAVRRMKRRSQAIA